MTTLLAYLLPIRHCQGTQATAALLLLGAALALASACSFDAPSVPLSGEPTTDGGAPGSVDASPETDAPPDPPGPDIAHVPSEGEFTGSMDYIMTGAMFINTTALTINSTPYPGSQGDPMVFDSWQQDGGGPELAVLHVGSLTVAQNAMIRVIGERPLVIIAANDIVITGLLDLGGNDTGPGAGGAQPGEGPGAGADGNNIGQQDSGGGGAGHGSAGARGGAGCDFEITGPSSCSPDNAALGGLGGPAYGDSESSTLAGGSGGGSGSKSAESSCSAGRGGSGGGAIQLFSLTAITINSSGRIQAGGGGGEGGQSAFCYLAASGGGGGSGGTVYLQAPTITQEGFLAANGGGGGAGGAATDILEVNGEDGEDGLLSAEPADGGSLEVDGFEDNASSPGGAGGAGTTNPQPGVDEESEANAGGGGGAAGYIVFHTAPGGASGAGITSPPATTVTTDN